MAANEIETPYSVADVAKMTGFSERTVTQLFEKEPGTLIFEVKRKRAKRKQYRSIRIPRHVLERVIRRISVG